MNGIPGVLMLENVQNANHIILTVKKCTGCLNKKPITEFYRHSKGKNGIASKCKCCQKEMVHRWCKENPEKIGAITKRWAIKHPDKVREMHRIWERRIRSIPKVKLSQNVSHAIYKSLRRGKAGYHWELLVGFTVDKLKIHLEKKFKNGMSWDNYGLWHIDHKIPMVAFNFSCPEDFDFRRYWSLKNLQPLWRKDNILKSNKIFEYFQPSLKLRATI